MVKLISPSDSWLLQCYTLHHRSEATLRHCHIFISSGIRKEWRESKELGDDSFPDGQSVQIMVTIRHISRRAFFNWLYSYFREYGGKYKSFKPSTYVPYDKTEDDTTVVNE